MTRTEFRTDDDALLSYQDTGTGPPVVLLHGWMMSGAVFQEQVEALATTHRVLVPDLRGCGESQPGPGAPSMDRYAADVEQLLAETGAKNPVVLGWSMGGGIAVHWAQTCRFRDIAGLGLVDFPPKLVEDPAVPDKICHNLVKRRDGFTRDFLGRMFQSPPTSRTLERMIREAGRARAENACAMYRAMHDAPALASWTSSIPAFLAFPVGGWFPAALAEWKARFPDHDAPPFPKSRHCPFLEEPGAFNQALRAFVHRVQSRNG